MSMNSGLTRDKHGALLRDGKPVVLDFHTGEDTPVIQDERLDVDLNRLVSNEMARQEAFHIPGPNEYADLTEHPVSRGAAEQRSAQLRAQLSPHLLPGENYELALRRLMAEKTQLENRQRELNATTKTQDTQTAPVKPATASESIPPASPQSKP